MIKMLAAVCRRPGMTHAEYVAYLQHVHGPLSVEDPVGLRRYVQNHVFDSAFGTSNEPTHTQIVSRDSVTELYWDNPEQMNATFQSEHTRTKVGPDGANFSDQSVALSLVAEDIEQSVPNPLKGSGAKVMHFLRAANGLALTEFFARWEHAHKIAIESPEVASTLRRCVHSRQLSSFNEMLAYFGGKNGPIYEGVANLWYDNTASVGAFRAYEQVLLKLNAVPQTAFYQPEKSFFLYATELAIYERSIQN